ncbi:MAG: hypothetical protein QXR26_04970 [Candidatus Caldarchaeum sp.]
MMVAADMFIFPTVVTVSKRYEGSFNADVSSQPNKAVKTDLDWFKYGVKGERLLCC